jgi:bidirectional [NiFe] hydrogenase diaphorase subunit
MIQLNVDERWVHAEDDKSLLEVCLGNGIYVPNLCFLDAMEDPPASCRLCFVDIEGEARPVSSCRVKAREGMVVRTKTPAVRELQRAALEFLISRHRVECKSCPANKKCALQDIARFLGVPLKSKHLDHLECQPRKDMSHPLLDYDPNRCVLCGRCIFVCGQHQGSSLLTFAGRGIDTVVSFLGEKDPVGLSCHSCLACVEICPVGAIHSKGPIGSQAPVGIPLPAAGGNQIEC